MNMKKLLLLLIVPLILVACAPKKTIVDNSCPDYKSQNFSRSKISTDGIAILPVTGGGEQSKRSLSSAINKRFQETFGRKNVKTSDEIVKVLNEEGISSEYSKVLSDYQNSGVVPSEIVEKLGNALSVDYLLYTELLTRTASRQQIQESFWGVAEINEEKLDDIYIRNQVWDKNGSVVWEGKGGSAKFPNANKDLVDQTANGLVQVVGKERGQGPCEKPNELFEAKDNALVNTYLVMGGVGLVLLLIIGG